MRKLVTKLAALAALTAIATPAEAIENVYRPYLGINYAHTRANAKKLRPNYNSAVAVLGSVYNRYFGTEVFYQYAGKDDFRHQALKNTTFNAYGLDMLAYLPLGCKGRIAPLATAGIGQYTFKQKFTNGGHNDDHGWGYRFGAGLQYNIDDNWAVRAIARYIHTDKIHNYDHLTEYTAGLRYTF
uniref:Outer membrane protein beta-barrel domain-containing protein n=1 Tax=uncultured Alphaproteobacteria bacterium TaxID=91750 RepID=A0A6G8F1Z5_9PROT|nr:hypothetical protein PlAlph_0580 [uncultured Alphaproteobacteria bacterium]